MTWFFITPLAVALVVAYLCKNVVNEVAYLAGSLVLISLLATLILAPWQVKIVLLALVLLVSQRLLQTPNQSLEEEEEEKKLTLHYRGANYEVNPPEIDTNEVEVIGKYRGLVLKTSKPKNVTSVVTGLKYRGASVASKSPVEPSVSSNAPSP